MTSSERRPDRAWRIRGRLDEDVVPEQVSARPDGSGWVFGWRAGPEPEARQGVILRVAADGTPTVTWTNPGWVRAGAFAEGVGFAVWGLPGPRFHLLRTVDGHTWTDLGTIPAPSVTAVLALRPDEAWLLGAGSLLRWTGAFHAVTPPADVDSTRDRLLRVADQVVFASPSGLWLARDAGARWGHRGVEGAHLRAIDFPYCAAVRADGIAIGRLDGAFVDWLGTVQGEGDPVAFGWDERTGNPRMQLAIVPHDPGRHPGIALAASHPDGGFATSLVKLPPNAAWFGLAGGRGFLGVAADRRLLQSGPT